MPRKKPNFTIDLPKSKSLPSIDPAEMTFAFQLFQAGIRIRIPMESPETRGIDFGDRDSAQAILDALPPALREDFFVRENFLSPKDTKLSRAMFALLTHYEQHPLRDAIVYRVMGFHHLLNDVDEGLLSKWLKPCTEDEEAVMMHPAVMDAVATCPTKRQLQR
jgi:hypothetical protein